MTQPSQIRPYDESEALTHGQARGDLLFAGLEAAGIELGTTLLDLGCGYGGLSMAYAKRGNTAYAIDADPHNVAVVGERVSAGEAAPGNVHVVHASALDIPLGTEVADLTIMIGVIEWLGYADDAPVAQVQTRALAEARRILKPGGSLIVGTKNRLFPRYTWSDSQLRKPLVNSLPRRLAANLSKRLWNVDYRAHIYSYWGWRRLIEGAGLALDRSFVPVVSYQYPHVLAEPWRHNYLPSDLGPGFNGAAKASGSRDQLRAGYYRLFGALGLLGLCGGSFLFVCRKSTQ